MPIVCIGLSHHTAPVEVRERHAFPATRMAEALVALRDYEAVKEAAMLQTCGRLEIYAEIDDYEAGVTQLKSFLSNFGHRSTDYDIESFLYTLLGRQAIEHLFRVSTGLDSMLIGEAEILGQVKEAYAQAQHARSLGKILHRLFREALNAGKTARSQTRIGDESVSVATAAVEAAKAKLGTLQGKSVVVIGAGNMGRIAVKRLRNEGADRLIVTNRAMSRARDLIAEAGFGEAIELPGLVEALAAADLVVTSTGASHFVVTRAGVAEAMAQRPERPLFIVDIAVPRDAEPEVAEIPNVSLVDIDGLKTVVDEKLEIRREVDSRRGRDHRRVHRAFRPLVSGARRGSRDRHAHAKGRSDPYRRTGAPLRAVPRTHRTRTSADYRHDDDDRVEAAALGDLEDPRESHQQRDRSAFPRARARRAVRAQSRRTHRRPDSASGRRGCRRITHPVPFS